MNNLNNEANNLNIKNAKKKCLISGRAYYRPFDYPEFIEGWEKQTSMFWTVSEVNMDIDRKQFYELPKKEQQILVNILRFFTQTDVEVSKGYIALLNVFGLFEVQAMLSSFCYMETIHVHAYAFLNDQLKLPEKLFKEFLSYKATSAKYAYITDFKVDTLQNIARTIAFMSGFIEGFVIFSAFCILLNLSRFGLMKGIGQVSTWSMRDETLHNNYMTRLFHAFIKEHSDELDLEALEVEIINSCKCLIDLEDKFIDECFDNLEMRGITPDVVKSYIRRLAEIRISALGFPFPDEYKYDPAFYPDWMDKMVLSRELVDFFSNRPTEYSKLNYSWKDIINENKDSDTVNDDWSGI